MTELSQFTLRYEDLDHENIYNPRRKAKTNAKRQVETKTRSNALSSIRRRATA